MMYKKFIQIGTDQKNKKILSIMASPRRNSNTENFLDIFVKKLNINDCFNHEKIILKDLDYIDCISCYGCAKVPYCVVKDDITDIYKKIDESNIIIFSTPIYFNSVSGIAKNFIDRMQVYWTRKFIRKEIIDKNKIGIALINGGATYEKNQFLGSELVFDHFFKAIGTNYRIFIEISDTDKKNIDEKHQKLMGFLNEFLEGKIIIKNGGKYEIK